MNAVVKVETAVGGGFTVSAFVHVVQEVLQVVRKLFGTVFNAVSSLTIGHLRNGATSLSSVTPDFT